MKQPNITVACMLALVYLLAGLGGVAERVICVGEDGHVGIKTARDRSCNESSDDSFLPNFPSSQSSTEDGFSSDESRCGPCVDIPVPSNDSLHKSVSSKHASKHVQMGGVILTHNLRAFYESTAGGLFSARPLETNSTLHSIRTVVLLI